MISYASRLAVVSWALPPHARRTSPSSCRTSTRERRRTRRCLWGSTPWGWCNTWRVAGRTAGNFLSYQSTARSTPNTSDRWFCRTLLGRESTQKDWPALGLSLEWHFYPCCWHIDSWPGDFQSDPKPRSSSQSTRRLKRRKIQKRNLWCKHPEPICPTRSRLAHHHQHLPFVFALGAFLHRRRNRHRHHTNRNPHRSQLWW